MTRHADGAVESVELSDLPLRLVEEFDQVDGEISGLLSAEDVHDVGESLSPGSSGVLLVWEAAWAARIAGAVRDSGGEAVAWGVIPRELVLEAMGAIEA